MLLQKIFDTDTDSEKIVKLTDNLETLALELHRTQHMAEATLEYCRQRCLKEERVNHSYLKAKHNMLDGFRKAAEKVRHIKGGQE